MFAGNWTEQGANFFVFVVLARMLGAEAFGLAAMATVFVLLAEYLVRDTMTETIIQLESVEAGHLDALFYLLGSFSLCIVILLIVLADPIAGLFSEPRVATYLVWATPSVLFLGLSGVPVASLRRKLEFRVLAIRATLGVLAGRVVGIFMATMDLGTWSLIAQRVTQVFATSALAWIAHPWRPGLRARRRHFHDVLSFSTKMLGLKASEVVSLNVPTVAIGLSLGPLALGRFTLAWRLVEILSLLLTTPIRYVAQPAFAHLHRSQQSAGDLLQNVMNVSSLLTFVSFFGVAAVSEPTIQYIFGDAWLAAVPVLRVLCLLGIYLSIERMQQAFCIALGRAGWLVLLSSAEAGLCIGATLHLAEPGLIGLTLTFTLVFLSVWPLRVLLVTRIAEVKMLAYLGIFVLPLALSLATFAAVESWQRIMAPSMSTLPLLVTSIMVGILVYAVGLWLTMRRRVQHVISSLRLMRQSLTDRAPPPSTHRQDPQ